MRFWAKLLLAFWGWYIFTNMGVLPTPLRNPLYPYIDRLDTFEEQKVSQGCYERYIRPRGNANLSVCATSGIEAVATEYTAVTDGDATYIVMYKKLFKSDNEEMDFHEIYGNLDFHTTSVAVMGENLLLCGRGNRGQYVQVSDGNKMHTAYSRWFATARGGVLKDYGFMTEMQNLASEGDLLKIMENLYGFLEAQRDGRITMNRFCALLYYQSQGILVDYDGARAVFVDRLAREAYFVYVRDADGLRRVAQIPTTTGHFLHGDTLYYSVGDQVLALDLASGESKAYYTAPDDIRFLNYFLDENELVLALVTDTQVVYYTPSETITGTHDLVDTFDRCAKGFYVSAYPYRAMLMTDDYPLGQDNVRMKKYTVEKGEP